MLENCSFYEGTEPASLVFHPFLCSLWRKRNTAAAKNTETREVDHHSIQREGLTGDYGGQEAANSATVSLTGGPGKHPDALRHTQIHSGTGTNHQLYGRPDEQTNNNNKRWSNKHLLSPRPPPPIIFIFVSLKHFKSTNEKPLKV